MKRPTAGQLEQRAAPAVAAAPTVHGRRLHGVIPYGVESRDLGGWREVMARGSLANAQTEDLIATVDHAGVPLARFPTTLQLEDRDDGLHWSLELPESRSDVREAVERGDLRATSWRMVVGRDEWRGNVRHVAEVRELRDVSIVTSPAYAEARAEYRAAPDEPPAEPDQHEQTDDDPPEPADQEGHEMRTKDREQRRGGALAVEDRDGSAGPTAESRVIDAMRAVPRGESRSLTEAGNAAPVTPPELSTILWDRLRDAAVVLASGVPTITTDRSSIKWPRLTADMTADFFDELEEITPSDPGLDEHEVEPKAIKALARGSSEAFEDSDPDLLELVQAHLQTVLALKLDRECLVGNAAKGFKGMTNATGIGTIDAEGFMDDYDLLLRAVGVLAGQHVPPPYVAVAHPWTVSHLSLLKEEIDSRVPLARPEGTPELFATSQLGRDVPTDTSTIVVYAPAQVAVVNRRDVTVEVDRSQEFSADAILVRGKVRASLFLPYPQAVCRIVNVPATDPSILPEPEPAP